MTILIALTFLIPLLATVLAAVDRRGLGLFLAGLQLVVNLALLVLLARGEVLEGVGFSVPWVPSLGLSISGVLDWLRAPLLVILSLSTVAAILVDPASRGSTAIYFLINAAGTGALLSDHALMMAMFWIVASLCLVLAQALQGDLKKEKNTFGFSVTLALGYLLILGALIALEHFSEASGLHLSELRNADVAGDFSSLMTAALFLGFSVTTGLWPLNGRWLGLVRESRSALTILQLAALPGIGLFIFLQIGLAAFWSELEALSPALVGLSLAGAVVAGVQIPHQKDSRAVLGLLASGGLGLSAAGAFTFSEAGLAGGLSLWVYFALGLIGLGIGLSSYRRYTQTFRLRREDGSPVSGGLSTAAPAFSALMAYACLSCVGAPGTPALAALIFISPAVLAVGPWFGVFLLGAQLALFAGIWTFYRTIFWGPPRAEASSAVLGSGALGTRMMWVLGVLILVLGLIPVQLIEGLRPAAVKILERLQ